MGGRNMAERWANLHECTGTRNVRELPYRIYPVGYIKLRSRVMYDTWYSWGLYFRYSSDFDQFVIS